MTRANFEGGRRHAWLPIRMAWEQYIKDRGLARLKFIAGDAEGMRKERKWAEERARRQHEEWYAAWYFFDGGE